MTRRTALWLLLAIVVIGIGLRAYHLTTRSLWFDEAFSWRLIQFPITEMLTRAAADVHPPLYYLLLKAWRFVFASSLLSLRSFSVVWAGVSIAAAYLFTATATRSRIPALIAAVLLAVSGFQIQFAWEARMYTLGISLVLISSYLLLQAVRTERTTWWLLYALTAAASVYVHYFALFSLTAQSIFVTGYLVTHTRGRLGEILQWRQTLLSVLAFGLIIGLFAPWVPTFLAQNARVQEQYWIPAIGGWSIPDTFYRMFKPTALIPDHTGVIAVTVAALPIIATIIGWIVLAALPSRFPRDGRLLIVLMGCIPFIAAILVSLVSQSVYQDRFLVFAHPFILIGLALIIAGFRPRSLQLPLFVLAVGCCIAAAIMYWNELAIPEKPGAAAAAARVFSEREIDEPVIATSPFVFFAIDHYGQERFNAPGVTKLYEPTGQLLHFAGGPILKIEDSLNQNYFSETAAPSLWVIDTTGFGEAPASLPSRWREVERAVYPEVFSYQGDVVLTRYQRD